VLTLICSAYKYTPTQLLCLHAFETCTCQFFFAAAVVLLLLCLFQLAVPHDVCECREKCSLCSLCLCTRILQCLLAPANTVAAVMSATRLLHACSWEVNNNNKACIGNTKAARALCHSAQRSVMIVNTIHICIRILHTY
jgi:hypothetical protein